jgi:hypothetical protein
MLPTFLVIGAKKAGSTSMHRYLSAHPDVFMPAEKHLDFFSGDTWERGVDWYAAQLAPGAHHAARGEASNTYSSHPIVQGVPARVAAVVPDVRLVYVIREPIARITSHYRQAVAEWGETRPFDEVVFERSAEYIATTRYAMQLDLYLEHFAREQLLVVTSEDLLHARAETLARVFAFIGVDPDLRLAASTRVHNQASDYRRQGSLVKRVRHSAAYGAIRERIPERARRLAWRTSTRPLAHDPYALELSPDARAAVLERLRPDLERLREIVPGFHCWGLLGD